MHLAHLLERVTVVDSKGVKHILATLFLFWLEVPAKHCRMIASASLPDVLEMRYITFSRSTTMHVGRKGGGL